MIIPEDVVCKMCGKVFCCSECRDKHELITHAIVVHCADSESDLRVFCPICQSKPLILHAAIHRELLIHIVDNHMPLNCGKCSRVYTKFDDLVAFSKCIQNNVPCKLEIEKALCRKTALTSVSQRSLASSVSTQTSPIRIPEINESHLTPVSIINLRWKAKNKVTEEFISDSVSSIKNISSINNSSIRKGIGTGIPATKGKLVRSTSTPLQAELFAKPKEQAFNVSGGHVSSIYNSASEPEYSPPIALHIGSTPSKRPVETVNRYQKPRCRGKTSIAVTPLQQVMSKSIQKAIAEHRIAAGTHVGVFNRKKMFDSEDTSDISEKAIESYPLDLRLSPALRRTQSEIINRKSHLEFLNTLPKAPSQTVHREIRLASTKKTTKSIVITSTSGTAESLTGNLQKPGNSVYQTCRSVEIITSTSTELNEVNINALEPIMTHSVSVIPPLTPRIPSSGVVINKKLINFETPIIAQTCKTEKQSPEEQFFTPATTPVRASKVDKAFQCENSYVDSLSREFYSIEEQEHDKIQSFGSDYTDATFDDEVFVEKKKPEQSKSKLWSLVSSVIRLPSLNGGEFKPKPKDNTTFNDSSTSLIKRCASFAGSLVRQKSIVEDESQALKRKRTYTTDCQRFDITCSESKRFRIQGRKPIKRMRCNN